ncbi:MAG: hypothetical protein NTX53_02065 [candidate division WOR-3 bacterium]|nr:hypothetical protein [candidate division WOR-3 bacterium]
MLLLWPSGQGIGVDLGLDVVVGSSSGGQGGGFVAGVGLKYAAMRRIGNSPLFYKTGAGASLLLDQGFNAGVRVGLEGGLSPIAARRVAFPVEGVLAAEVYGGGGAWVSLGLSLGAGGFSQAGSSVPGAREGHRPTFPAFSADAKARHDKMVEFTRRVMSDERGTMSAECDGFLSRLDAAPETHRSR